MADRRIEFYQIYYKLEQADKFYPFAIPYFNPSITPYFENSIIANIVPKSSADLIAVCSWRLRQKRGEASTPRELNGDVTLTEEKILNADFDIAILTPRKRNHQPLFKAELWHGSVWVEAFNVFKKFLKTIGIVVPEELDIAIYENHFIAKREIYQRYVSEALIPAMAFMDSKEVFLRDSNYVNLKRRNMPEVTEYLQKSGRNDWPIAPFVLERLFSLWIYNKGFNIINL
jgi:hypothetical protein